MKVNKSIRRLIFTLKSKMIAEQKRLEQELKSIQNQICGFPDGKLLCVHNGNYIKWHQSDGHQITYIPKKNRELAQQLAMKKYLCLKAEELIHKQDAIQAYLQQCESETKAEELYELPEYAELLLPLASPKSQELKEWMKTPFTQNPLYPEQRVHKTSSGILVRSKSEAIITMLLHMYQIPFRYECALQLGDSTVFPDFTVRHPQTQQYYYWEHFGMMDNDAYSTKALSKLQLYMANEIFPSIQLITTYETKDQPLDSAFVEMLIKYYFL